MLYDTLCERKQNCFGDYFIDISEMYKYLKYLYIFILELNDSYSKSHY